MTITTNNNRQIWLTMIILFSIGMVWNTYYAKYLSEGYVELLEVRNEQAQAEVMVAKAQRDSARIERMRLAFQLQELDSKIQNQNDIIDAIQSKYNQDLDNLNNLRDEKDYIPDNTSNDDKFSYLSGYEYKPY